MIDCSEALAILHEFGVRVVPPGAHPRLGETKAVVNFQKIINARGYEHGRFLIMTWKDTMVKQTIMDGPSLWAISDVIKAVEKNFPDLLDKDVEKWFAFFDALQIGWLQDWAKDLDGVMPKRYAMGGQIYERIKRVFGITKVDLLDDRRVMA
jgi:hypothetical protein